MSNPYQNLDTLYDFLVNIKTVDEFFAKREVDFDHERLKSLAKDLRECGLSEEAVLHGLKSNERSKIAANLPKRAAEAVN